MTDPHPADRATISSTGKANQAELLGIPKGIAIEVSRIFDIRLRVGILIPYSPQLRRQSFPIDRRCSDSLRLYFQKPPERDRGPSGCMCLAPERCGCYCFSLTLMTRWEVGFKILYPLQVGNTDSDQAV